MIICSSDLLWLTFFWRLKPFFHCPFVAQESSDFLPHSRKVPAVFPDSRTHFLAVFTSGWNASQIYAFFKQLWRYFCILGALYDPIQRLTSQTQEGRNPEGLYSIKRSVWASFLFFKPAWTPKTSHSFSVANIASCGICSLSLICINTPSFTAKQWTETNLCEIKEHL